MRQIQFNHWLFIGVISAALTLAGCSLNTEATTPTAEPETTEQAENVVSATGVVRPERWVLLGAPVEGVISGLDAQEGQQVEENATLATFKGRMQLEAELSAARQEVVDAQQALDDLQDSAGMDLAQAKMDMAAARQAVIDAEREAERFDQDEYDDDLEQAREDMINAEDDLQEAQDDFEPYADLDEDNPSRKQYEDRLDDARETYNETVWDYQELALEEEQAQSDLSKAQAELEDAERRVDAYANGPDPDDVARAQARLDKAQATVTAAEQALADLTLQAPFSGTVGEVRVRANEYVLPGDPMMYLGDLENLRVETTDLSEISVARINTGDPAIITFDALPGVQVGGRVIRITPKAAEGSGVNYTVILELDEIPDGLLWGMTAFVDIEVE